MAEERTNLPSSGNAARDAQQSCGSCETGSETKTDQIRSTSSESFTTQAQPLGSQLGSSNSGARDSFSAAGAATSVSGMSGAGSASFGAQSAGSASEDLTQKLQRTQDEARQGSEQLKSTARETADELRRKGSEVAREAKQTTQRLASDAMHTASDAARQAATQAQHRAASFATDQKSRIASELSTFGDAISRAAETLREGQDVRVASYADAAAQQLRATSDWLQSRDLSEITGDVENFARRRPEVFFGGMLLIGLGIARFLKASSRPRRREDFDQSWNPQDFSGQEHDEYGFRGGDYYAQEDLNRTQQRSMGPQSYSAAGGAYSQGASFDQGARDENWPETEPSKLSPMNDPLSYH